MLAVASPGLTAGDVATRRRLFTTGACTRLDQVLPLLAAALSTEQGLAGAAWAADVWMLAFQLVVEQGSIGGPPACHHFARHPHTAGRPRATRPPAGWPWIGRDRPPPR